MNFMTLIKLMFFFEILLLYSLAKNRQNNEKGAANIFYFIFLRTGILVLGHMVKVHFFLHSKIKFKRINHTFIMKKEYHSKTSNMTPGTRDLVLVCGYIDHIVKGIISLINSFSISLH